MAETADRPAVACAVIVRDRHVLLVRRREREGSLLWALPGGKIEAGENAKQAAVREVLEETGLTVKSRWMLGQREHPDTGRTIRYVACAAVEGEAHVADAKALDAVEWVPLGEASTYVPGGFHEPVQRHLDVMQTFGPLPRGKDLASGLRNIIMRMAYADFATIERVTALEEQVEALTEEVRRLREGGAETGR